MKKIGISFKENVEEMKIYEFLKGQMSPSIYIKELLKEVMEKQNRGNE